MTRIVLAYDGSPSASAAIVWIRDSWRVDVVTLTLDLGQRDELDAVRERALAAGAMRAHVLDIRDAFARDVLMPALRAGAACEDGRPLGRSLSRAAIARQLVDVARMEGTQVVAHCAWRDAADRARLERAIRDLAPEMEVRAPLTVWNPTDDEIRAVADAHALRLPPAGPRVTADVWGRCLRTVTPRRAPASASASASARGGGASPAAGSSPASSASAPAPAPIDDTGFYVLTKGPAETPATPAFVDVVFERGTPVGINGVGMPLLEIISSLETIAGAHGVGRSDGLDAPGPEAPAADQATRVHEICESPAATVLDTAHRWLERGAADGDLWTPLEQVRATYRELVHRGAWATLAREACQAFIDRVQARVSGSVRLKLSRGRCRVVQVDVQDVGRESR